MHPPFVLLRKITWIILRMFYDVIIDVHVNGNRDLVLIKHYFIIFLDFRRSLSDAKLLHLNVVLNWLGFKPRKIVLISFQITILLRLRNILSPGCRRNHLGNLIPKVVTNYIIFGMENWIILKHCVIWVLIYLWVCFLGLNIGVLLSQKLILENQSFWKSNILLLKSFYYRGKINLLIDGYLVYQFLTSISKSSCRQGLFLRLLVHWKICDHDGLTVTSERISQNGGQHWVPVRYVLLLFAT